MCCVAIQAAYEAAKASGVYNNVKQYTTANCRTAPGGCVIDEREHTGSGPAYALNTRHEYFAETTEAFFGTNDYYPYNAFQLHALDPTGFELVRTTYGQTTAAAAGKSTYPASLRSFESVSSAADAWQTPVWIRFTNSDASCSVNVYLVSSTGSLELVCSQLGPGKQCNQAHAVYSQVYVMKRTGDNVQVSAYVARQVNVEVRFDCSSSSRSSGQIGRSTSVQCVDNHASCAIWAARGECARNPGYMLAMCKKSCDACSITHRNAIVQQTPCVDLNSNCHFWSSTGQCTKNPRYMLTNCRKSCNNC